MSGNLKHNYYLIGFITNKLSSEAQIKAVLLHLSDNQLKAIKEVLINILQGNLLLSPKQRNTFFKYKTIIRKLAVSKNSKYFSKHHKIVRLIMLSVLKKLKIIAK